MPTWTEEYRILPVHAALGEASALLAQASSLEGPPDVVDRMVRVRDVVVAAKARVELAEPNLVRRDILAQIEQQARNIIASTQAWIADKNPSRVENNVSYAEALLGNLIQVPSSSKAESSAARRLTEIRIQLDAELKRALVSLKEAETQAAAAKDRVNALEARIQQDAGRLDAAIADYQQKFGEAQDARGKEFLQAIANLTKDVKDAMASNQGQWETLVKATQGHADSLIKGIQDLKLDGERLVEAASHKTLAEGYRAEADQHQKSRKLWRGVGFVVLAIPAIVATVSLAQAILGVGGGADSGDLSVRLLASAGFVPFGLAAFRLSAHAREAELENRQRELQLASLDAYLAKFSIDKQVAAKDRVLELIFGFSRKGQGE